MRWAGAASGVVVLAVLAGCIGGADPAGHRDPAAEALAATLRFEGVFDVFPTAMEPEDQRGTIQAEWRGGLFAIDNEKEWDLAAHTVVDGDTAYTSATGAAWTSWSVREAVGAGRLSNRLLLWDLPALLADPAASLSLEGDALHAALDWDLAGRALEADVTVAVEGDRPASATVASPQGREAPFTIVPGTGPLRFPVEVPSRVLGAAEVDAGDAAAKQGHDAVAALVTSYCRTRAGVVPESVDPESLRVEMLSSGASWPEGAYDGQPLRADGTSGHFLWERSSPTQGTYTGMGWDGALVLHYFGPAQCRP